MIFRFYFQSISYFICQREFKFLQTEVEEDDKEKVAASISTAEVSSGLQPLVSARVLPEHLKLTDNDELNIEYSK